MEYRICWSASTNINFRGATDWEEWDGYEESATEVEDALYQGDGQIAEALGIAIEASGFDYWVELR